MCNNNENTTTIILFCYKNNDSIAYYIRFICWKHCLLHRICVLEVSLASAGNNTDKTSLKTHKRIGGGGRGQILN